MFETIPLTDEIDQKRSQKKKERKKKKKKKTKQKEKKRKIFPQKLVLLWFTPLFFYYIANK